MLNDILIMYHSWDIKVSNVPVSTSELVAYIINQPKRDSQILCIKSNILTISPTAQFK